MGGSIGPMPTLPFGLVGILRNGRKLGLWYAFSEPMPSVPSIPRPRASNGKSAYIIRGYTNPKKEIKGEGKMNLNSNSLKGLD